MFDRGHLKLPAWLRTERVLGSLGLPPNAGAAYEAYIPSRVLELGIKARRKELESLWGSLRRGWYVGGADFRKELLNRIGQGTTQAAEGKPHNQSRAEQMLGAGLTALGLGDTELSTLPKGQTEKLVLAWWLYGQTTVNRRWVAQRLVMGYETRVSQAVSLVESSQKVPYKK